MASAQLPEQALDAAARKRPLAEETAELRGAPSPMRRRARTVEAPAGGDVAPRTVGDIVGRHATVLCPSTATLGDAADLIVLHDRSAAAVVDDSGALLGSFTENDIIHAYSLGVLPTCGIDGWLRTHIARLPKDLISTRTVRPTATLMEAAEVMRQQAFGDTAFRHLVVQDDAGRLHGILSSLDLARAMCSACPDEEVVRRIGTSTAADVMKPRGALPVCNSETSLSEVLEAMSSSRQNCALVADGALVASDLLGIVTPRDALRAFAEHVPTTLEVGHWLRGVQASWETRAVQADDSLRDCAAKMAKASIHHLVVLSADARDILGVVSSTDLAQAVGSAERVVDGCAPLEVEEEEEEQEADSVVET